MNGFKRHRAEIKSEKGETIHLIYDENADILEVFFGENEPATGVELTDHILLRLNRETGRTVSLTLFHFSIEIDFKSLSVCSSSGLLTPFSFPTGEPYPSE